MSPTDFVAKGQALVASGQFQEAVKVCRLGLLGRPTAVEGRIVLGQALLSLKRYDEVVAEMRVALDLDPTSITAQALKGEALIEKGDQPAALEVLKKAKSNAPGDKRITELIARSEKLAQAPGGAASAALGFVGAPDSGANKAPIGFESGSSTSFTKEYPDRDGDEGDVGHYTRPTSISTPGSKKKPGPDLNAARGRPPRDLPPEMLNVGDKSMTMEAEILEDDDDDFDDLAPPPGQARGAVVKSASPGAGRQRARGPEQSVVADLASDDMIEVDETAAVETVARPALAPRSYTAVRNAVQMPSGPLDAMPPPASTRKTALAQPAMAPPSNLASMIAQAPHMMQTRPPPGPTGPPPPFSPSTPVSQASLQQTVAAPLPPLPPSNMPSLAPPPSAAAATMIAMPAPPMGALAQTIAAPMSGMSGIAGANDSTARPDGIDPRIAALVSGAPPPAGAIPMSGFDATAAPRRRKRSPFAVFLWIVIGGGVIGGGVFAGFQIRAMRLQKQISAARTQAVDLAKADTWKGWSGARDRLAGIAQASATVDNRAALARARGVLAYEFGDGQAELTTALTRLNGQGGADDAIAAGYAALDAGDPKAAKTAADAALAAAPNDGAAHYIAGVAAELAGDDTTAIAELQNAFKLEPRPLYAVSLGHALAQTNGWADAIGSLDRALAAAPDHPAAIIEKAFVLVEAGQLVGGTSQATDIKLLLGKIISEGAEPFATQTRGISPLQVALANLALAQVELALGDGKAAAAALVAAAKVGVDDQRFAEEALETLFRSGALEVAEANAERLVKAFPASRRGRVAQAQILIARGKPADAITALNKSADAAALPRGLAVRGQAKLSLGDLAGARADFEAALKKSPALEAALVGKAWVLLADNDTKGAKAILEPGWNPNAASPAYSVAYASALRRSSDTADREKARALLEKVVAGPVSLDAARAHLELGRLQQELGDLTAAKADLQAAVAAGLGDARVELAELQLEERDPQGGHDTLEAAFTAAPDPAPPALLIAVARSRALVGDTPGAIKALDMADKSPSVARWQLDRERGRLALRRGDLAAAAEALTRALDKSETDRDTLLLAADAAGTDLKTLASLAERVKKVAGDRFKDTAEEKIVLGKLDLAEEKAKDAVDAYSAAATLLGTKSSSARLAQVHFGLAVAAYFSSNEAEMSKQLDATLKEDPTLYVAYLFAAQLSDKQPKEAIKFATKAVQYNPEYVDGWISFGQLAQRLKRKDDVKTAVEKLTVLAPESEELKALKSASR